MKLLPMTLVLAVLTALAACSGIPNDGRYATHDGGRSNNRAEAPADTVATRPS
jgi:hypothetical protein